MPVIGVKRANSELNYQTPAKKSASPGLWTRFISSVSRFVSYLNLTDSEVATVQPAVDDSTGNAMEEQNSDTTISAPCTRPLFTPVLSELERNEKRIVTTPSTVQPSRSPLFSPMFLSSNYKHHHESILTTTSSKQPSSTGMSSHILSTNCYSKISKPVLTSSRFASKDRSSLEGRSSSLDQSRYRSLSASQSRCMDQSRSRKNRSIVTSHSRPQSISNNSTSAPIFSLLQTPLLSPTASNHIEKTHVRVTPQHSIPPSNSRSPVEELQQWISEFKDTYHSSRKDLTAQIDAAEKYARLQSDQRNQLCDQRMEQLRKRFDSGLDIKELFIDDYTTTEEQPEMRLQHDAKEKELIQKAFGPGPADEELSCAYRIRLKRRDFQTLYGLHWLNDEVVNFYMSMIADTCSDVHSYSSFFYPKLIGNAGYSGVRRWTKKVDIFSKRLLLIPVHLGMHWCLAAVDFDAKQISYYDSFKGHNPECLLAMKQYLVEEAADKKQMVYDTSGWQCVTHKNIPSQENGSDCGVFMCMYARHLARNKPFQFSQNDMPRIREHMVLEMLEQKLI